MEITKKQITKQILEKPNTRKSNSLQTSKKQMYWKEQIFLKFHQGFYEKQKLSLTKWYKIVTEEKDLVETFNNHYINIVKKVEIGPSMPLCWMT